jgi:hypothetical protein
VTALIAVGCTSVRFCVAVKVDCACEVAVIVTTLLVGTVAGAVYNPPLVIEPVPVPPTLQFTRVLLKFVTLAVHCEVPSTVTLVGTHEIEIVGVVVAELALLPQELRIAGTAISAKKKRRRSQRTLSRPKWKFGSSTRNPPRPHVADFPEEDTDPSDGANIGCLDPKERFRLPLENASRLPVRVGPLRPSFPTAAGTPHPHTCNQPGRKPFRKLD